MLNAFRHHGVYRPHEAAALVSLAYKCSTPFGITEYIGGARPGSASRCGMCSTPFGITEYIGVGDAVNQSPVERCSTPFGITEYIGHPSGNMRRYHVLNAFRHHGVYRPRRLPSCCARSISAQRLSASRSISGLADDDHHAQQRAVLNAFRHHGVYRIRQIVPYPWVVRRCSTPFGITEYIGIRGSNIVPHGVLVCSTPFGITEYIGGRRAKTSRSGSAQRLSASRSISAGTFPYNCRVLGECSTPFGITEYIGFWTVPM